MMPSPGDNPLSELEDEELKRMLKGLAGGNIQYSIDNVTGELRYREERNISRKQTYIAVTAVVLSLVVAATNIFAEICK